jgi:serine/threonine protein kinase
MEYVPHLDLQHCVQQALPESEVRTIIRQVVEALEVLHARKWAHRDLKPSVSVLHRRILRRSPGLERICH